MGEDYLERSHLFFTAPSSFFDGPTDAGFVGVIVKDCPAESCLVEILWPNSGEMLKGKA